MTKFDDVDFHDGDAAAKGQPVENAFTHIGFMFVWLVRHDLVNARTFSASVSREIASGSIRPNDLRDLVDGQLLSSMLKREASAFLAAYYPSGYGADFDAEFGALPDYGVSDDPEHQARIERRIDAAYEQWLAAGRPGPKSPNAVWKQPGLADMAASIELPEIQPLPPGSSVDDMMAALAQITGAKVVRLDQLPREHSDPELEKLVSDAVAVPLKMSSSTASGYGSATLLRTLRRLGVRGKDVSVVHGLAEKADPSVSVDRIPGVDRARLAAEYGRYLENRVRGRWRDRTVGDIPARTAPFTPRGIEPETLIWFAVDEFVVYIAGRFDNPDLDAMAVRLLEALRH
jgi:hypothetical protein